MSISNGNFSWGFPPKRDEEEDKEREEENQGSRPRLVRDLLILKNINLKVKKGEFITVIGE